MISARRLKEIHRLAKGRTVAVIGDLMLDEFLVGAVERISPEAPVPVLAYRSHRYELGGAGNAARSVSALSAKPKLVGAVGKDQAGAFLLEEAEAEGLDVSGVVTAARHTTTLKTRVIAHSQQVVRIDREAMGPLGGAAKRAVKERALAAVAAADAVLISDYDKGTITTSLARDLLGAAADRGVPVVVDSKAVHAAYRGATLLTPNLVELGHLARVKVTDERTLARAATAVLRRLAPGALLVTRAEEGMSLFGADGSRLDVPALATEVHDVTGAGDTVAAAVAVALAAGLEPPEAARLATLAAAVVVRKVGTAAPAWEEMAALAAD
jgi:D-beta-D-heptose 7-phosphate kinase/D-beta-D-heptose 1-phosphate adenosyltransferase